jgi:dihydroneopterin aldolase/D-erythro-7,8-dihydroneopterin triphosphate epimerase
MDRIFIEDLLARCIIGINPDERREKQDIIINIILETDLRTAGKSDRFEDTVDYRGVKKNVLAMVECSQCFLIEALAERIAGACLENPGVQQVTVAVRKPSALRFARSVGVEIVRKRD